MGIFRCRALSALKLVLQSALSVNVHKLLRLFLRCLSEFDKHLVRRTRRPYMLLGEDEDCSIRLHHCGFAVASWSEYGESVSPRSVKQGRGMIGNQDGGPPVSQVDLNPPAGRTDRKSTRLNSSHTV